MIKQASCASGAAQSKLARRLAGWARSLWLTIWVVLLEQSGTLCFLLIRRRMPKWASSVRTLWIKSTWSIDGV